MRCTLMNTVLNRNTDLIQDRVEKMLKKIQKHKEPYVLMWLRASDSSMIYWPKVSSIWTVVGRGSWIPWCRKERCSFCLREERWLEGAGQGPTKSKSKVWGFVRPPWLHIDPGQGCPVTLLASLTHMGDTNETVMITDPVDCNGSFRAHRGLLYRSEFRDSQVYLVSHCTGQNCFKKDVLV